MINKNLETCFQPIEETKQPRLIKTHLSLPLLPHQLWHKKAKVNRFRQVCIMFSESKRLQTFQVVYLVRNPKDAMVSQYYHGRSVGYIKDKTLDEFIGEQIQMPPLDDPIQHVAEFYALRNEPWLFYTSFERMKLDLRQVITDVCRFLEKTIDGNTMQKMLSHLSFEEMKKNPKTNHIWEYEQIRAKNGVDSDKPE